MTTGKIALAVSFLGAALAAPALQLPGLDTRLSHNQKLTAAFFFTMSADVLAGREISATTPSPCVKGTERMGFLPNKKAAYTKVKKALGTQGFTGFREKKYETLTAFQAKQGQKNWIGGWTLSTSGGDSTFVICQKR